MRVVITSKFLSGNQKPEQKRHEKTADEEAVEGGDHF